MSDVETVERPMGVLIMAAIDAVVSVVFAIRLPAAIGSFRDMFAGFGAELEAPTKFVLAAPYLWVAYALAGFALLVWVGVRTRVATSELRLMRIAVRAFIVIFGLTLAFSTWALYLPIFKMGQAV